MAGKTVKLEFDVGLTSGSGENIRRQLQEILSGIGTDGLEIQSFKVNPSAISRLRSEIQSSLKDIPITFKASDITTSAGAIAAGAGNTLKSVKTQMSTTLRDYEKAMKEWQKYTLSGDKGKAESAAKEATSLAQRYREIADANKDIVSLSESQGKIDQIRSRYLEDTSKQINERLVKERQLTEEAEKRKKAEEETAAAKKKANEEAAAAKQKDADEKERAAAEKAAAAEQKRIQTELNSRLTAYKKIEKDAQNAALDNKSNAGSLAEQASRARQEYEQLANTLTDVEQRYQALNNLSRAQANIVQETAAKMDKAEEKKSESVEKSMQRTLDKYTSEYAQYQKAMANGNIMDAGVHEIKAQAAEAEYRKLAESIEDVTQREQALNAIEEVNRTLTEKGTEALRQNAEAQAERIKAQEDAKAVRMSDDINSQISELSALDSALVKSTDAYRQWQEAQAGYSVGTVSFDELQMAAENLENVIGELIPASQTLSGSFGNLFGMLSRRISMTAFMAATRAIREMISAVRELDASLTQMQIVTGGTDDDIERFSMNIAQTAKTIGSSITDLVDSATVFARLGYTEGESSTLAKFTSMLSNVGDIDVGTAQNAITSIVKAFGMGVDDVEGVMDKMVEVGNHFPISVAQIAEGMTNAGSTLKVAGNSIEQSIALLTAANTSVQNVNKSSTGLRTIAARLRRSETELNELGETVTTAKYQQMVDMLTKHAVSLVDENGELRDTYSIIQDIAGAWDGMTKNEQAALAEMAAGTRQQNIFTSLILNFKEAQNAMTAMADSGGALTTAYDVYMDSIQAHIGMFKASFQELAQSLFDSGMITDAIDSAKEVVQALQPIALTINNIVEAIGGLKGALAIFIGAKLIKNVQRIVGTFASLAMTLGDMSQVGARFMGQYLTDSLAVTNGLGTTLISGGAVAGVGAYIAALTALIVVADRWKKKQEELRKSAEESAKSDKTQLKNFEDIRNKYQSIAGDGEIDASEMEQLNALQSQIAESQATINGLIGEQSGQVDLVNGKYQEQIALLNEIVDKQASMSRDSLMAAAAYAMEDYTNAYDGSALDDADRKMEALARTIDELSFHVGRDFGDKYGGSLTAWLGQSTHNAVEMRDVIGSIINDLSQNSDWRDSADSMWGHSHAEVLSSLTSMYNMYNEAVGNARDITLELANVSLKAEKNELLSGKNLNTVEDLKAYRDALIGVVTNNEDIRAAFRDGLINATDLAGQVDSVLASVAPDLFKKYTGAIETATETTMKDIVNTMPQMVGKAGMLTGADEVAENITKLYGWLDKINSGDFDTKDLFDMLEEFPTLQEAADGVENLSTDLWKLADAVQGAIDAAPDDLIGRIDKYMDSHILSDNVKAQLETWKEYLRGMTDLTNVSLPERVAKIKEMQDAIYNAANDTSGITLDNYNALIKLNSKFADAIVVDGNRIVVNSEKAMQIVHEMGSEYIDAINEQISADRQRVETLNALERGGRELTAAEAAERASLEQNIQRYQALRSEIFNTLSAYEQWSRAQSTSNAGSEISELESALDHINKVTKGGKNKDEIFGQWNTDDFRSALALFGQDIENFMSGGTLDTSAVQKWSKEIGQYFKKGEEGVANFVEALHEKGLATIENDILRLNEDLTLDDIADAMNMGPEAIRTMLQYLTRYGAELELVEVDAGGAAGAIGKINEELTSLGSGGNVDLLKRPIIDAKKLLDAGWEDVGDGIATLFTSTFTNEDETIAMNFTPIMTDENGNYMGVLSPQELQRYAEEVIAGVREDDLNLKVGATYEGEDAVDRAEEDAERIHKLHEELYSSATESAAAESQNALRNLAEVYKENDAVANLLDLYDQLYAAQEKRSEVADTADTDVLDSLDEQIQTIRDNISTALEEPLDMNSVDDMRTALNNAIQSLETEREAKLELGLDTSDIDSQISTLQRSLSDIEGTVEVKSAEEEQAKLEALQATADAFAEAFASALSEQGTVNVDSSQVSDAIGMVGFLQKVLADLNNYHAKTYVDVVRTGDIRGGGGGEEGGSSGAYGGAFAKGGRTLVGELGEEMVVDPDNSMWYTVGSSGAEFVKLPKHAIVFNHKQTKSLLSTGKTGDRGKALASGDAFPGGSSLSSLIKNTIASAEKAKETLAGVNALLKNSTKNSKGKSKGSGSGSGGGSGSSSGSSNKSSDKDNWFIKQYKENNHLVKMDKKEQKDYLNWLDGAYKKAYKQGIIDLDDYRKYAEEVYEGLKDLFLDSIDDTSSKIDEMMNYDGAGKQIVNYYNQIINSVQKELKAAYARGLDDNDDYVQELKSRYWEYANALKEYEEGIVDDAKDAMEELIRYRMKMITKELNDEKDNLQERLKDMKDFYDEQKKMLHDTAENEDYLKEQAEKRKKITDLEIQLSQLSLDTSVRAQKKRLELEEDLVKARDELYTFERDHTIGVIEDEYDKMYDTAEKATDAQIEEIDEKLEDQKYLYQTALEDLRNNNLALYNEMIAYNEHYIDGTGDALVDMWERAYEALYEYYKLYGKTFEGIELGNFTNWQPTTANTGTLTINGRKYARGTSNAKAGVHQVDEVGPEQVFVTASGNRYRLFHGGEKVLNAKATQFLYDFANSGGSIISDALRRSSEAMNNLSRAAASIGSVNMGDIIIQGNATEKTVSEIRRSQRESVDYLLKEFKRLGK